MKIKVNIGSDTRGYWIWNTSLSLLLPVHVMCLTVPCVHILFFLFLLFQFLSFVFNESNITTWMKDEVIESILSGKFLPLSLSSKLVILLYLLKSFNHSHTFFFSFNSGVNITNTVMFKHIWYPLFWGKYLFWFSQQLTL